MTTRMEQDAKDDMTRKKRELEGWGRKCIGIGWGMWRDGGLENGTGERKGM